MTPLQPLHNEPGIYAIWCLENGRVYIGQSVALRKRFRDHRNTLAANKHGNPHLQHAYNKYGDECFVFDVIVSGCDRSSLDALEVFYMEAFNALVPESGFNICDDVNGFWQRGRQVPDSVRKKISSALRGKKLSESAKKKIGDAHRGKTMSEHSRRLISAAHRGRSFSPTTRILISQAKKGKVVSEAHKLNIEQSMLSSGLSHGVTFKGQTKSYRQWSRELGIPAAAIYSRIKRGWAPSKALTEPIKTRCPSNGSTGIDYR